MNFAAISNKSTFTDCYALNTDEVIVNLHTGKDVTAVSIIHDDPFAHGCMGHRPWYGTPVAMKPEWELKHNMIWSVKLRPEFKREQYYFSITAGDETVLMFEDGFYTPGEAEKKGRMKQYFKFPWLNSADVITPPDWVNETVWYQIMPDRFCRGSDAPKRFPTRKWSDGKNIHFWDTYGGDLKGITEKLEYLRDLGITGIYMTPIFLSNSNHKYNTFSYETIDPDFGTEEELVALVDKAHSLGIRVMMDAVFNHCGTEFAPWQDAVKNGPESPYWDWFFINQWPLPKLGMKTEDGRYYSFAFGTMMPKLNTNNPEVIAYFQRICSHWVRDWHIDGIRFDVGNEVSHKFLKELGRSLKQVDPDVFLLGEIWHDSSSWLQGDEYDSVMNYPFMESLHNFWLDDQSSRELMYSMNRCMTLYPKQLNNVLFNFLDTHDTMRAVTRCGSVNTFFQQLAVLMTMPGSACIYYGTEIALPGGDDPDCRRPMPWDKIAEGKCDRALRDTKALIEMRKAHPETRMGEIIWKHDDEKPRFVRYARYVEGSDRVVGVYLNAQETSEKLNLTGKVLFSRNLRGKTLMPGGVAIVLEEPEKWIG